MSNRYECYKRYLSSCNIRKCNPRLQSIMHIFFTRKTEIPFFDFNVNNSCSLRCKKCDQGIPYLKNREIYRYDELKSWIDNLLEKVNYVYQISILGGEPFLNIDLDKIINYCKKNKKIGSIIVVTNGTIFPNERIIQSLKHKKIIVGISWYPIVDDSKRRKLIKCLEVNGINYHVRRTNWLDFGDWTYSRNYTESQLKKIYDNCFLKDCIQYNKGVLYHCARQRLLMDQKIDEPGVTETINVNDVSKEAFEKKYKSFASLKTLKACNYCNSGEDLCVIPLGEQL